MTQIKTTSITKLIALVAIVIASGLNASAQEWKNEKRINVLFGLAQPVLASGFNIEGNYIHNRFIFDYSHGASLDFKDNYVPGYLRRQNLAIHEPWTTGFGIGYRLKEWVNVRVEPKWHRFEFYYDGETQNQSNQLTSYNTFSLGVGVYFSYRPFKNSDNFLKGLMVAPSIRFWPTVHSSLNGGEFTYLNKVTGNNEQIKTLAPGSGFSPLVVNVSVGYSFLLK